MSLTNYIIAGLTFAAAVTLYILGQTYHDQTVLAFAYTSFGSAIAYIGGVAHGTAQAVKLAQTNQV